MLSFIWMCLIGLVAGALAKLIMPGRDPGGIFITMLLGIAGSIVAGFLGRTLGWYREGDSAGLIMSVVGAILLLWVYRMFRKGSTAG
ncbi:GlsB/YeaQ/YmgE family stress response membrane protein [Paludibaculum fermentans]|uniref:GlsB/YeaQ/YmgE family stress response membrane protein n=1 Tax=Paludibaculum fermentans TaxID=1473598 RepID=A0A7S7NWT7_PALFE|nr:GlsB/YeaQ/YmgE family stress response membrane protein [Paludibaculum fermentans]QOY91196.1 GlsB/YeaQ/YmgE family stress response membrane protein [Paludibaculum fermentans]